MTEEFENNRIEEYMTRTTWLHFQGAMEIGKIQLFAGRYRAGEGSDLSLSHYVDAITMRPLLHDLSWGKPVNFVDYKGTVGDNGAVSRVLRVNTSNDGKTYWTLTHGPGTPTKTGAVMPKKDVHDDLKQKLNIGMEKEVARQIAYSILEYMIAWRTASLMAAPLITRKEISPEVAAMTIQEINDDLFDDDFGSHANGHRPPSLSPEVAIVAGMFLNGETCPHEFKNLYDQFVAATGGAPRDQEHMINWRYRN
jgi:hypothetical protein